MLRNPPTTLALPRVLISVRLIISYLYSLVGHMGNIMNASSPSSSATNSEIPVCSEDDIDLAERAVAKLQEKDIRLLAFDFDQTLVTVHTRGVWKQSASKLAQLIRPCLVALIRAALQAQIDVGVVTYSMQPKLIEDVLSLVINSGDLKKVIIRGNTKDWERLQGVSILGKQQHLASILQEVNSTRSDEEEITGRQILLLDDDGDNVKIAEAFDHKGFVVEDDVNLQKFIDYLIATL